MSPLAATAATALCATVSAPVLAEGWLCRFETSCARQDPCRRDPETGRLALEEGAWSYTIDFGSTLELRSISEPGISPLFLVFGPVAGSAGLFTLFPDGSAALSTHFWFDEPRSITRHGSCTREPA